jgi:hypothetical protein
MARLNDLFSRCDCCEFVGFVNDDFVVIGTGKGSLIELCHQCEEMFDFRLLPNATEMKAALLDRTNYELLIKDF